MPKRYRQVRVMDLIKVPMRRLEWDLNLRPSGAQSTELTTEPPYPTHNERVVRKVHVLNKSTVVPYSTIRKKCSSAALSS